jgi:hypothetical protein
MRCAHLKDAGILLHYVKFRPARVAGVTRRERLDRACTMFGRSTKMLKKDRPRRDAEHGACPDQASFEVNPFRANLAALTVGRPQFRRHISDVPAVN